MKEVFLKVLIISLYGIIVLIGGLYFLSRNSFQLTFV